MTSSSQGRERLLFASRQDLPGGHRADARQRLQLGLRGPVEVHEAGSLPSPLPGGAAPRIDLYPLPVDELRGEVQGLCGGSDEVS